MTPRLSIWTEFDDALSRQKTRLDGMFQTGRLLEVDPLTALCKVLVYGFRGQTAEVSNVVALDADALTPGFDVLCLAPENGRLADLGYVVSHANGPSLMYSGLALTRTNTVTASTTAGAMPVSVEAWRTRFEPPADGGALLVSSIRLPVMLASPNTRAVATVFGGGGSPRLYVPRTSPMALGTYTQAGDTITLVSESEPFRLEQAETFQIAAHADRLNRSQPAEFQTFTSTDTPDGGRLTPAGTRPVVAAHGRIAVRVVS